jgi:hypothetical protein
MIGWKLKAVKGDDDSALLEIEGWMGAEANLARG